jgi:hypothetical protein
MANSRKSDKYPDYDAKFIAWMKHTNSKTGEVTWTDHVKVSGLLDRAHKLKFKRVTSCMLQAPFKENGNMCICHGEVETADGHIFSAVADATPENVKPNVRNAFVRMADTRAIGRALRWALNIDGAAAEEIVEDDAGNAVPYEQASKPAPTEAPQAAAVAANGHVGPADEVEREPVVTTTENPIEAMALARSEASHSGSMCRHGHERARRLARHLIPESRGSDQDSQCAPQVQAHAAGRRRRWRRTATAGAGDRPLWAGTRARERLDRR